MRSFLRARLREVAPPERGRWSEAAARRLLALPELGAAASVLLFRSLPAEIDTSAVAAESLARGQAVYFPAVRGPLLAFHRVAGDTAWREGPLRVLEPVSGERFTAADLERGPAVVVVPALAFSERGERLGRGGGHYDRALAALSPAGAVSTVGLAFELQILEALPVEAHDVPVQRIVTERREIRCR